jgi:pimeloyl-ACP methyl ester carboxylesterase
MRTIEPPFHPIVYVRGYAMTESEIAATVSTPYMGFNDGSVKVRQSWDKRVTRHIFESPLIRLMKDYDYKDVYAFGAEALGPLRPRTIVVYRYYEPADKDLGTGKVPSIEAAAKGLADLIERLREQVAGADAGARAAFRVHLVAHSMGGLVVRCLLQNQEAVGRDVRPLVDKVFTYATPHNGIETFGMNVPAFLGMFDIDNFNRKRMAKYLGLAGSPERVDSLDGKFPPERFFCLVGTNYKDYDVAAGLAKKLAGEMSDGLVAIQNAAVQGAPRAFVHRSHSGPYGIVNSEDGYQNLVRFLFGDVRVDGRMEVVELPLPPTVAKLKEEGKTVRGSYYFEVTVAPRGALTYSLTERKRETHSAVLRTYDELMKPTDLGLTVPRTPVLFSAFLDTSRITVGNELTFSVDVAVSTTGYTIDGFLWLDQHIPGEYLLRETLTVRARREGDGWKVLYVATNERWGEDRGRAAEQDDEGWFIPLASKKFSGRLRLELQRSTE